MFLDLDPRLMRGARLGVAALAGFAFAVAFVAGSRAPRASERVLPRTPVAERTSQSGPALAPRFEPTRPLPDLLPAQAVAPPPAPTTTASRPAAAAPTVTATTLAPTTSSPAPAPPVVQPVPQRNVPRRTAPAAPHPSRPAPAPETFDSSGTTTFDSSG
jgi:hypothetical protein